MAESSSEAAGSDAAFEHRLIVAGFGGQGVLTLGKLLCMAAMRENRTVTYLPSYGSEVRGGTAKTQVVISSGAIYSPLVEEADSLIILNELSFEKYASRLKPGGLLVANDSLVDEPAAPNARLLALPASEMAVELGNLKIANVLMMGAFIQATGLIGEESCCTAIEELLGARKADLLALNLQAFRKGMAFASEPVAGA